MPAIQDFYPPEFSHCYGCGTENSHGHKLKSHLVDDRVEARVTVDPIYSGGFPKNVYGGLLASLLDCHGTASAAAFAYLAKGRQLGDELQAIRFVTGTLKVVFHKPTPLGVELILHGKLQSLENRKAIIDLSLGAGDIIFVSGEMIAIQLPEDF